MGSIVVHVMVGVGVLTKFATLPASVELWSMGLKSGMSEVIWTVKRY